MIVSLECKKIKRTGFLPALLGGGVLAAIVPIINMTVRSEQYLNLPDSPMQILLSANWQMIAMLNVLLVVAGTCLLYHTEYADNAMQKMKSLPIRENSVFFGKAVLIILMSLFVLLIEAGAIAFCFCHWFNGGDGLFIEVCKYFGYFFLLMTPCAVLSLLISEACKNMWVSLGIGVICVFIAIMLPTKSFALSLFPFAMPFQIFADTAQSIRYIFAAVAECVLIGLTELIFIKVRRSFE